MKIPVKIVLILVLGFGIAMTCHPSAQADGDGSFGHQERLGSSKIPNTGSVTPVPEPTTMFLLASGIAGLYGMSRRNRQKR